MTRPLAILVALVCACTEACADQVDQYINQQLRSHSIPGVALTVLRDGKQIKTAGYGVANLELDAPTTSESVFEVGALAAQFTAGGIISLKEAGKLSFDDPISKYLQGTPLSWRNVTVADCLRHTSGLKSYALLDGFELRHHLTQEDFIKLIGQYPLDFDTGTKVVYSATDTTLLGYIIVDVSGQSYRSYLEERIFRPLGMNSTYDRDPLRIIPNRASGYVKTKQGTFKNRDYDLTDMFAAGDIAMTVSDFAKWDNAMNGTKIFSETSRALLWTSGKLDDGSDDNHGFIFHISSFKGQKEYYDTGATGGFSAAHVRYPESGLSVVVMANNSELNIGLALARGVADIYLSGK